MPDPAQLEHEAALENREGHHASFAARGERRVSDLDRRAQIAAGNAASEGPKYHADYQRGYQ